MAYYKPQSPIKNGEDYIYPLTTVDQVMLDDGSRLNAKYITINLDNAEDGGDVNTVLVNADSLGGVPASDYALKASTVSSVNGVTQDENGDVAVRKVYEKNGNDYVDFSVSTNGVRITESTKGSFLYFRNDTGNVTVRDADENVINHLYGTVNKPTAADVGALATDGTAAAATKLATARTIRTNLASTSTASFNGTANVTPGVTGTLPIANGGTGNTTGKAADSTKFNGKTWANMLKTVYPVGSIYLSVNSTSPASLFGGTWEQIKGRFLLASGTPSANSDNWFGNVTGGWNAGAGSTGGQDYHTLTVSEMPNHNHTFYLSKGGNTETRTALLEWTSTAVSNEGWQPWTTDSTGGNAAHNNMPPYLAVYMWKRTA